MDGRSLGYVWNWFAAASGNSYLMTLWRLRVRQFVGVAISVVLMSGAEVAYAADCPTFEEHSVRCWEVSQNDLVTVEPLDTNRELATLLLNDIDAISVVSSRDEIRDSCRLIGRASVRPTPGANPSPALSRLLDLVDFMGGNLVHVPEAGDVSYVPTYFCLDRYMGELAHPPER